MSAMQRTGMLLLLPMAPLALSVTAAGAVPTPTPQARSPDLRVVIATNVACRAAPAESAPAVRRYFIGDAFMAQGQEGEGGDAWYLDRSRTPSASGGCWIHGSLTAPWASREEALLAAADRALARRDEASFDDLVAVDNVLRQTVTGAHAVETVLEGSPLLQLRRLQIVDAAASVPATGRREAAADPLKSAWFFSNRDVLRYHEPAGRWFVVTETYWALHDRHRAAGAAEEIAWVAAQGAVVGDECDGVCELQRLARTYARYWEEYPEGLWIDEALARGVAVAEGSVRAGCHWATVADARAAGDRIRTSLERVSAEARATILGHVDELEESCGAGPVAGRFPEAP